MNGEKNDVALWSGVVAFFSSLLAIGIFDAINPDQWLEYLGAIEISLLTAAGVYARQRYQDARKKQRKTDVVVRIERSDKINEEEEV